MRWIVTPVIALFLGASLSACGSSSSAPSPPKAVLPAYVVAALAQKSVHWWAEDREVGGDHDFDITADLNADSGWAWVSWGYDDDSTEGAYRLVQVNRMYYVRGDSVSLRHFFGLTKAQARRYAGRWISTPKSKGLTLGMTDGLTLPSIVGEYGGAADRTSARATGVRLPGGFSVGVDRAGLESVEGTFSKWNESVRVQAPARSTPIATVRG